MAVAKTFLNKAIFVESRNKVEIPTNLGRLFHKRGEAIKNTLAFLNTPQMGKINRYWSKV